MDRVDVSVVLSTYNRCELLKVSLDSLLAQEAGAVSYEVVVVDNNSTDRTRQVVESYIAQGHCCLRYVFEPTQGLSYGRNAGIANSRGGIVAFTDDDVEVCEGWVAGIKGAFDEHPEVDFVGGKVLPRWRGEVPSWLTRDHWTPLALIDYGDEPFVVNLDNQLCLISANLSFRREIFETVGFLSPSLQRVKDEIGSMEDHQFLTEVWRANRQGMYVPHLIVTSEVASERMTKTYHRRWHRGHGSFYAIMREEEMERTSRGRLFDVPGHLYKQALKDTLGLIKHSLLKNPSQAFKHEVALRFFAGFFRRRRRDYLASVEHGSLREIAMFAGSLKSRKRSAKLPGGIG